MMDGSPRRRLLRPGSTATWLPWLLAVLPGLAGGLAWGLLSTWGRLPSPVVYMRFSLGLALSITGGLLSLLAWLVLALVLQLRRRAHHQMALEQSASAAAHRRFVLRLDHELKNPLTALQVELANLEILLPGASLDSPSPEAEILGRLKSYTQRLADLSVGLRKLAELETHPIEQEPVEIDTLLQDLASEITQAGSERRFSLDLPEAPWRLPPVTGDADLIELVLRNVLANAFKFTYPGDSIQVRAFEDGNWVTLEVTDTGPGIPEQEQEQVWEELFRGKEARGTPGSGLGLALVRAVIQRHGGQALMRSQVGRGTRVTIRLPAFRKPAGSIQPHIPGETR